MKRFLIFLMIIFSLTACSSKKEEVSETEEIVEEKKDEKEEIIEEDKKEEKEEIKEEKETGYSHFYTAMITNIGGVNDESFNQSAWEGLKKLGDTTDFKVSYLESKQETDYEININKLIESKADLIWGIGYMMENAIMDAAIKNPEVHLAIIDTTYSEIPDNLTTVVFRDHEPSFLAGYMASYVTETNKVGFIGGMSGHTIGQFEYGYRAGVEYGAKEQNKEIEIQIEYAESFVDDVLGEAMGMKMYNNNVDIIFHAAGNTGQGVIRAAKTLDKLVIGVDKDQSNLAPDNVMTSVVKLVGNAVIDVSKRVAKGEDLGGQALQYGLKENAAGIPEYEGSTEKLVEKKIYDKTMKVKDKIISGEIIVPNNEESYNEYINQINNPE